MDILFKHPIVFIRYLVKDGLRSSFDGFLSANSIPERDLLES